MKNLRHRFFLRIFLRLIFCVLLAGASASRSCAQTPVTEGDGSPSKVSDASVPLENLAERNQNDITDDARETDLAELQAHPLNVNRATADELMLLPEMTMIRSRSLILYRKELGDLISIHELQAVPGWDPAFIRSLLRLIYVGRDESLAGAVRERWFHGDNALLLRAAEVVEKPAGYHNDSTGYLGSPQKLFLRYSYNFKQLLQYGFSGEKDPGEPFFRGPRKDGFDFYSFHFFLRRAGIVQSLALGDFTVNFGQGLIAWQTIAFAKGGGVATIKREAPAIKPYHSAGEFNFHRGIGITLARGNWQATFFASRQAISTHPGSDTLIREDVFTSFQNGGYHRTRSEIATRNNNRQFSAGGSIIWHAPGLELGLNAVYYHFSAVFQKRDEPYNLFAFQGSHLAAGSFHYGYTFRNWHLFGEAATDQKGHPALIQGLAGSLARDLDIGFIYRNISRAYRSLYADAFTKSATPVNEKGLYGTLAFGPRKGWKLEMYYDLFQSSWLTYRNDSPGFGRDWNISANFQPVKKWSFRLVYRSGTDQGNRSAIQNGVHIIKRPVKQRIRLQFEYQFSHSFEAKWRTETVWNQSDPDKTGIPAKGTASFLEIFYHYRSMNGNCRIQRFDIPGYDLRLYIYESDMMYNYALPAVYNSGWSYYINLNRTIFKNSGTKTSLRVWIKWSQAIFDHKILSDSGLNFVSGNKRSRWSVQFFYDW